MKSLLAAALALTALPLLAQTDSTTTTSTTTTSTPASAPSAPAAQSGYAAMMQQATATLTPAEKDQLNNDRIKVMSQNPDLQAEEMGLMQKVMAMQGGDATDADKASLRDAMRSHGDKVRAAMIKLDPSVEAVIQKVEAQVDKLRAQYQAQAAAAH